MRFPFSGILPGTHRCLWFRHAAGWLLVGQDKKNRIYFVYTYVWNVFGIILFTIYPSETSQLRKTKQHSLSCSHVPCSPFSSLSFRNYILTTHFPTHMSILKIITRTSPSSSSPCSLLSSPSSPPIPPNLEPHILQPDPVPRHIAQLSGLAAEPDRLLRHDRFPACRARDPQ